MIYKMIIGHDEPEKWVEERFVEGLKTARIAAIAIMDYADDIGRVFIENEDGNRVAAIYKQDWGYVERPYIKDKIQSVAYVVCPVDGNRELIE